MKKFKEWANVATEKLKNETLEHYAPGRPVLYPANSFANKNREHDGRFVDVRVPRKYQLPTYLKRDYES